MIQVDVLLESFDRSNILIVEGPYGVGKSRLIPNLIRRRKPFSLLIPSDNCNVQDVDLEHPVLIIDAVDTNTWQIEFIICLWLRKRKLTNKLVLLGSSPVTDRLSEIKELKVETYFISYVPYQIRSVYAPDENLPLVSLAAGLKEKFCIIDGEIPSRKVTACPELLFLNPKSQKQVSRIFSKLGLRNPVTVYFLLTKSEFLDLPETHSNQRLEYEKNRMLRVAGDDYSFLIFQDLSMLAELNKKIMIQQSHYICLLEWESPFLALLEFLEDPGIEDTFTLCLLETSLLVDTSSRGYIPFLRQSVIEAYSTLAITILDHLPEDLIGVCGKLGLNYVPVERAVFNYKKINPKKHISQPALTLRKAVRRLADLIPEQILQYHSTKDSYISSSRTDLIFENPLVSESPPLLIPLRIKENLIEIGIDL